MTAVKSTEASGKLEKFVRMLERLRQPGIIQISPEKVAPTVDAVKAAFRGKLNIWEVPAGIAPDARDTLLVSFRRAETLLAVVRSTSDPAVLRLFEEIVEDGAIDAKKGKGWKPAKPVEGWNLLVVAEEIAEDEPYFKSAEIFPYKLRI
jgi:hypothetical protein